VAQAFLGFLDREAASVGFGSRLGDAFLAFLGKHDAAFGEAEGLEARDDLEEGAEVGGAWVWAAGEFEEAQLELVLGEGEDRGLGIWECGMLRAGSEVILAGLLVLGDAVAGVELAERARADLDAEGFAGVLGGLEVGAVFAGLDERFELSGCEGGN